MDKNEIIALADDFINRFYAGDILIVTPPDVMRKTGDKVNDLAKEAAYHLFSGRFNDEIIQYVTTKSVVTARRLLKGITSARSRGMIVEKESNSSKIKRLEQENAQLKEESNQLQKEIKRLKKLNNSLHETIKRLTPAEKDGLFGDEL